LDMYQVVPRQQLHSVVNYPQPSGTNAQHLKAHDQDVKG
jgi:hypothetical protein